MPFVCAWMVYRTLELARSHEWEKVRALYKGAWSGCTTTLPKENTAL
jgi:hypothetical protein